MLDLVAAGYLGYLIELLPLSWSRVLLDPPPGQAPVSWLQDPSSSISVLMKASYQNWCMRTTPPGAPLNSGMSPHDQFTNITATAMGIE